MYEQIYKHMSHLSNSNHIFPSLHLCPLQEPEKRLLYINICSWKRVPAPEEPKQPVPLYAGKLETETEHSQGKERLKTLLPQRVLTFEV